MISRISILLPFLALLGGCQRENTRVIDERRAAVDAKLERIQGLAEAVKAIPPVTAEGLTMGSAPLALTTIVDTELPTGTIVYESSLKNLKAWNDEAPHYNLRIMRAQLLEECGALLTRGALSPTGDPVNTHANIARQVLDSCANLQYVFVLRTRKLAGREFSGDVVAFELSSGKHLGGFPIEFTSAGRVDTVSSTTRTPVTRSVGSRTRTTIKTQTTTTSVNADADQLRSDLATEIEGTIKRLVPSVSGLR